MRKTTLNRTTIAVVAALVVAAVTLGVMRNMMVAGRDADVYHDHDADNRRVAPGTALFNEKGCAGCHFTDSTEAGTGPGLKGLFDRETLPSSGRRTTINNVREQLIDPYRNMPSFADRLTEEEIDRIISYLKAL